MEGSIARGKDKGERIGMRSSVEEVGDDRADMAWTLSMGDLVWDNIVLSEEREDMIVQECGGGAVTGDGIAYHKNRHRVRWRTCTWYKYYLWW